MYRAEMWKDGWLWIQNEPDEKWHHASIGDTIVSLRDRIAALETAVAELKKGEP